MMAVKDVPIQGTPSKGASKRRPPAWFRELQQPEPVQHTRPAVVVDDDVTDVDALHRLWRSVLNALLEDAGRHWQGKRPNSVMIREYELEAAFDDVLRLGPMTQHVCSMTGDDPEAIRDAFVRWCELAK